MTVCFIKIDMQISVLVVLDISIKGLQIKRSISPLVVEHALPPKGLLKLGSATLYNYLQHIRG